MSPSIPSLYVGFALVGVCASAPAAINDPTPVARPEAPDATLSLSGGVIALGIGYEWVHGTLNYEGHAFAFHMRGMSIMDIGVARISGTGEVFNLKSLAQFEGRYGGTTFGSAVGRGESLALVKNEQGVTIRARSAVSGIRFNFSGSGLRILFDELPASGRSGAAEAAP